MDNEKYLEQLTQELQAKQEKEKDITAAVEYASNLLKLHLPVIFDRKHFALLTGCELIRNHKNDGINRYRVLF